MEMMDTFKILFIVCLFAVVNSDNSPKVFGGASQPRIVIVGAGAAGVAAASKLFENGFKNVKILEAEDWIGGRIYTASLGDNVVDLGAQWIHGTSGNIVFELAYPLKLLDNITRPNAKYRNVYFQSDGYYIPSKVSDDVLDFSAEFMDEYDPKIHGEKFKSIAEFANYMFDDEFKNDEEIMQDKQKFMRYLEISVISVEAAESWNDLPLDGNSEYYEYLGDQMVNWKDKGFSMFIDVLTKKYPNSRMELPVKKNTILNTEVTLIDTSNTNGRTPVLITTADGSKYEADHVIVTIPLGALKERHRTLFARPLPMKTVRAIEGLAFGTITKVFLLFEKPFWFLGKTKRVMHYTLLWNDEHKDAVEKDPEKQWVLGISSITTVEHKPNVLEIYVVGKHAKLLEKLPNETVFKHAVEVLYQFLGKKLKVTPPYAIVKSEWYNDPHFRGCFTYRSFLTEKYNITGDMLSEPINESNLALLFAGEATSTTRFGTVDGAVVSGFDAADRIMDHYNKSPTKRAPTPEMNPPTSVVRAPQPSPSIRAPRPSPMQKAPEPSPMMSAPEPSTMIRGPKSPLDVRIIEFPPVMRSQERYSNMRTQGPAANPPVSPTFRTSWSSKAQSGQSWSYYTFNS